MSTNPWGEPVVVYEDADGEVTVFRADPEAAGHDDLAISYPYYDELYIPVEKLDTFAHALIKALYEKAGRPVPELVFPVGSVTMQPGEDWWKVVDRAGRQHATVFPDPAEAAKAAAWAGDER